MNIFVCCKEVPDTAATPRPNAEGTGIVEDGLEFVVSPFDENAIEAGLKLTESLGAGTVTLVCVAPDRAQKVLRSPALAMGAHRAILVSDPACAGSDSQAAARVVAKVLSKEKPDLILCGKAGVDDGSFWFGPALAHFLGLPHVTEADKIEVAPDRKSVTVHRAVEDGTAVIQSPLPCVVTANKALNAPRYPSLKGIMKAKKQAIESPKASDLGLEPKDCGKEGSRLELRRITPAPEKKKQCVRITDEPPVAAARLAKLLREEAKVV